MTHGVTVQDRFESAERIRLGGLAFWADVQAHLRAERGLLARDSLHLRDLRGGGGGRAGGGEDIPRVLWTPAARSGRFQVRPVVVSGGADQITVMVSTTATNTNALSATQLDPIPYDGNLILYTASTAADSTLSLKLADQLVVDARTIPQVSTTGIPRMSDDVGFAQAVINGVRAAVVLTIVTAGTIFMHATLQPSMSL